MVTVDVILNTLREWVENKIPIPPDRWLDAAEKINMLQQDEEDEKTRLEIEYFIVMKRLIEDGNTHAKAQTFAKTTEEYRLFKKQESRCKIIKEMVMLAKKRASIDSEWKPL